MSPCHFSIFNFVLTRFKRVSHELDVNLVLFLWRKILILVHGFIPICRQRFSTGLIFPAREPMSLLTDFPARVPIILPISLPPEVFLLARCLAQEAAPGTTRPARLVDWFLHSRAGDFVCCSWSSSSFQPPHVYQPVCAPRSRSAGPNVKCSTCIFFPLPGAASPICTRVLMQASVPASFSHSVPRQRRSGLSLGF
jgi:hypothetical protein